MFCLRFFWQILNIPLTFRKFEAQIIYYGQKKSIVHFFRDDSFLQVTNVGDLARRLPQAIRKKTMK
jgi:hypothetical protein